MKPNKPCKKCGKHPRLKGMFYCAECKAEIAKEQRAKKRAYMKVYTAAKKAAKEAAQAAAIVEAAKEAANVAAELTPPQPGQWTTTSITTVTTNGENPPTVHTETKTEPTPKVKHRRKRGRAKVSQPEQRPLCSRCGERPAWKRDQYCRECRRGVQAAYRERRRLKEKAELAAGTRTGVFALPCSKCGKGERVVGRTVCSECRREEQRYYRNIRRMRRLAALQRHAEKTPITVQQNNTQNNKVQDFVQPTLPFDTPEKAPIVVQQNNIQNNAPMHDLETVTPKEHTLNVNVTNPIKVDVQHTDERKQAPWWIGYLVASAFFLLWLGSMIKNWFK